MNKSCPMPDVKSEEDILNFLVFYNKENEQEVYKFLFINGIEMKSGHSVIISVDSHKQDDLLKKVMKLLKKMIPCVAGFLTPGSILAFIPSVPGRQNMIFDTAITSKAKELYNNIRERFGLEPLICVGMTHEGLAGLNKSFKEALELVRHNRKAKGMYFYSEDFIALKKARDSKELLERIESLERNILDEAAASELEKCISSYDNFNICLHEYFENEQYKIKFRTLSLIMKIYSLIDNGKNDFLTLEYKYEYYLEKFMSFESMDETINWVKGLMELVISINRKNAT